LRRRLAIPHEWGTGEDRMTMSERPAQYGSESVYIERWITFVLADGKWNFKIWADHELVAGKVFQAESSSAG
jgi:hypothetical protein